MDLKVNDRVYYADNGMLDQGTVIQLGLGKPMLVRVKWDDGTVDWHEINDLMPLQFD